MDGLLEVVNKAENGHKAPLGLRTVAIFELAKGLLVLAVGLGVLSLLHRDVGDVAEDIVRWLHFDPARHYPAVFIDAASKLTDSRLWLLSFGAMIYAAIRFLETYGLWHERSWAEWFAVLSAGLYLPVEVYHVFHSPSWVGLGVLSVNLIIVIYLGRLLAAAHHRKKIRLAQPPGPP